MVVVYLVNMFIVGIVVAGHYECLYRINRLTPQASYAPPLADRTGRDFSRYCTHL
jgi:hypothetical protein